MPTPGSPAWHARLAAIKEAESKQPITWWYLSFAEPGGKWKGGVFVEARGIMGAVDEANLRGINPGGEVKAMRLNPGRSMPEGILDQKMTNRLLTRADLDKYMGGVKKWTN